LFLVLFLQAPLSIATLSLIEPILIAILLAAWITSFYVGTTLGKRYGAEESTPIFRHFLPGHILVADGLKLLVLFFSVGLAWAVWSSQPFRIFNATVLGTLWTGITLANRLVEYRQSAQTTG
jgi:prepilin signal peptidase PulO-like enzyme (type II secretory pathway)